MGAGTLTRNLAALLATRRGRVAAFVALCAFALAFQGSRGIWKPDEGRYVNVAMIMLRTGDWLWLRLDADHPHLSKPPLTYWAIAGSIGLLGRHEMAARLPDATMFVATVLVVYMLGKRFTPARPWLPALIYATSALPYVASNIVTTDTVVTFWETLAVLGFAMLWWRDERGRPWVPRLMMWVAFGLGFATKGPPALLPLLAVLAFALYSVGRVVGKQGRNARWYDAFRVYVPVLLLGALPWTFGLLRRVPAAWRLLRQIRRPGVRRAYAQDVFLLLWFLLPLALFLVASSRLPLYVLPLCTPLALLLARHFRWEHSPLPLRPWVLAAWVVVLVSLRWGMGAYPHDRDNRPLAAAIREQVPYAPGEIVFVETRPRLGLSLYFDVEVERADLDGSDEEPGMPGWDETLAEELAEDEPARLYIVAAEDEARFVVRAAELGRRPYRLGHSGKFRFFRLDQP